MKQIKPLLILFTVLLVLVLVKIYVLPLIVRPDTDPEDLKTGKEMVIKNYGKEIDSAARIFNLPASYLKALCMLECGGRKAVSSRVEPHIIKRLNQVKNGTLPSYEHVNAEMLEDADDAAIMNLASSWGPFQLMGYKCLLLDIKVRDIRGDQSVYYGAKWIDLTYGDILREGKYKDAFHIHNTGKPFPAGGIPQTYHPSYCKNGLEYMKYYDSQ